MYLYLINLFIEIKSVFNISIKFNDFIFKCIFLIFLIALGAEELFFNIIIYKRVKYVIDTF